MVSFIYNVILLAVQIASGSQGPPPPTQNRGPQLPIDDHIWILILAGIILGIYIAYKRRCAINKTV